MNQNTISRKWFDLITSVFIYLFVYSGLIKWVYPPIDLTLVFGLLASLAIVIRLLFLRDIIFLTDKNIIFFFSLLHLFAFASIIYTQSTNFYIFKLLKILLNVIVLLFAFFAFNKKENINTFLKVCYFFWIVSLVVLAWQFVDNKLEIIRSVNINDEFEYVTYAAVSYYLGVNIFLFINRARSVTVFLLIAFSLLFMIILAGKGPLLMLSILLFFYLVLTSFSSIAIKFRNLVFFVIFLSVMVLLVTQLDVFSLLVNRVNSDDEGATQSQSVLIRVDMFNKIIGLITSNPFFGVGIGGQGVALNGQDVRSSPHNFILEIAGDLGFLGVLIFFCLVFFYRKYLMKSIRGFRLKSQYLEVKSIYYVVVYLFMESMVSSFWEDIRILYFWFAFSLIQARVASLQKVTK
jgi:O-antigen ligase